MAIADKTYWLDANRELTETEPESGFVLINEGQEIPAEMADKYGIGKVTPPAEGNEDAKTVKSAKPAENKKAAPKADKGAK